MRESLQHAVEQFFQAHNADKLKNPSTAQINYFSTLLIKGIKHICQVLKEGWRYWYGA